MWFPATRFETTTDQRGFRCEPGLGGLEVLTARPDAPVGRNTRANPPAPGPTCRPGCGSPIADVVDLIDVDDDMAVLEVDREVPSESPHPGGTEVHDRAPAISCDHSVTSFPLRTVPAEGLRALTWEDLARSEGFEPLTF